MSEHHDNPGAAPVPVGGEMAYGSDAPAPLGVLLDLLREPLRGASSVLLLGATAAALAEICPAATAFVRRTADAEQLASRGVRVLVGGLDRLPREERADLVIQLDPPGRVLTPDSPGCSHAQVVAMAAEHVAPGGRLVALVPGPLGPDRANSPYVPEPDADDAWWVGTEGYDERPPTLRELPCQPTHFVISSGGVPNVAASAALAADPLVEVADAWLLGDADQAPPADAVWTLPAEGSADRPRHRPGRSEQRIAQLTEQVRKRDAELAGLRTLLDQQLRRVRALEHAIATEHGPLARRTLFVMTAPVSRIVEAARARRHR